MAEPKTILLALPVMLRMHFIDSMLHCYGWVDRAVLIDYFQISPATATRDIAMYVELAPGNMVYVQADKAYIPTKSYKRLKIGIPTEG